MLYKKSRLYQSRLTLIQTTFVVPNQYWFNNKDEFHKCNHLKSNRKLDSVEKKIATEEAFLNNGTSILVNFFFGFTTLNSVYFLNLYQLYEFKKIVPIETKGECLFLMLSFVWPETKSKYLQSVSRPGSECKGDNSFLISLASFYLLN